MSYKKLRAKLCAKQQELIDAHDILEDQIKKLDEGHYKKTLKKYLGNCYRAHKYLSKYVRCETIDSEGKIYGTIITGTDLRIATVEFGSRIYVDDDLLRSRKISHKQFIRLLDGTVKKLKSYKPKKK